MFNVKWGYPINKKVLYIAPLPLLLGVRNVKTTCRKSWPGNLFQLLTLTFDPFFNVNWGHLKREITTAAVVLFDIVQLCNYYCRDKLGKSL